MNPNESRNLLNSVRQVDRASIFEGNTQKPFNFQSVTLDLSVAQLDTNPKLFNFPFKTLYVQSTTDSSTFVDFKPNAVETYQSKLSLGQNDVLTFADPIASCSLSWTAQPGKSITLIFLVNGELRSGKLISVTSGGVSITDGTNFTRTVTTLVGAVATSILASNSNRTVASIKNNTGAVLYVGESTITNAGATQGFEVGIGQVFQWRNTAQLYAYSAAGGNITILEELL